MEQPPIEIKDFSLSQFKESIIDIYESSFPSNINLRVQGYKDAQVAFDFAVYPG
jgi:hypothetical protein